MPHSINPFEHLSIKDFILVARPYTDFRAFYQPPYKGDTAYKYEAYFEPEITKEFHAFEMTCKIAYNLHYSKRPKVARGILVTNNFHEKMKCLHVGSLVSCKLENFYEIKARETTSGKEFGIDVQRVVDYAQDKIYYADNIPDNPQTVKCFWDYNCWYVGRHWDETPWYGKNVNLLLDDPKIVNNDPKNRFDEQLLRDFTDYGRKLRMGELEELTGVKF